MTSVMGTTADLISRWPEESREAATLVIEAYGEPDEATESQLIWHGPGPWKRIVAQKAFQQHDFPAPHIDCVESFIDYRVPIERLSDVAAFDGSIMIERTSGEASARCHDEQANVLALNLMHDIVSGARDVDDARGYYAKEFLDARRKRPTPYMEGLRVSATDPSAADADDRVLTDDDLAQAKAEGAKS